MQYIVLRSHILNCVSHLGKMFQSTYHIVGGMLEATMVGDADVDTAGQPFGSKLIALSV